MGERTEMSTYEQTIEAARMLAQTISVTLGPFGRDKLIVSGDELLVTNDGATVLAHLQDLHPIARLVAEVAEVQEQEIGDGTTSAVIIASALLQACEHALKEMHPTQIIRELSRFGKDVEQALHAHSREVIVDNEHLLTYVARTAMTGKGADSELERLAQLVAQAAIDVHVRSEGSWSREDISLLSEHGRSVRETRCVSGTILDYEPVHPRMPSEVTDTRILLLDTGLELSESETRTSLTINSHEQLEEMLAGERKEIESLVNMVVSSKAGVVCTQKGIDDRVAYMLATHGIIALRRVSRSDLVRLSKATGARIISDLKDVDDELLGACDRAGCLRIGEYVHTEVISQRSTVAAIHVRASTQQLVEEVLRALSDAIGDVYAALQSAAVVAGAGAIEIQVCSDLSEKSDSSLYKAFAGSLLSIPRTLAHNAGLDSSGLLADIQDSAYEYPGIGETGLIDAFSHGIVEPLGIKLRAIQSAIEVATMILRIDDVLVFRTP